MDKPFAFSLREFNAVRQKIRALTGINLADSKDNMVYSRLARRLRALNLDTFQAYLRYLDDHQAETEHFINALTTNLTSFFREAHHFEQLFVFFCEAAVAAQLVIVLDETNDIAILVEDR